MMKGASPVLWECRIYLVGPAFLIIMSKRKNPRREDHKSDSSVPADSAFKPDDRVLAQMKNGQWHDATVLKVVQSRGSTGYEYYVHYLEFNRRNDEYINSSRIQEWRPHTREEIQEKYIEHDEHEGLDEKNVQEHEESTKFKTISYIQIGKFRCETWYFSPFPEHLQELETLFICEHCFSFFIHKNELVRHAARCLHLHPPGNEIYRDADVSVFEVDGGRATSYCENLCYISKLFLDHKNLQGDVDIFMFYILTEVDSNGCHFVGYFSKEKESHQGTNLSCILVMPFAQRGGYGKFLITLSYELSKIEKKVGSPERPLSDLGHKTYFTWWAAEILTVLERHQGQQFSITEITEITFIKQQDVLEVLERLSLLRYSAGQHIIYANPEYLRELKKITGKPGRPVYVEKLHWTPLRLVSS